MKLFVAAKGFISRPDGQLLIVREGIDYDEGTEAGKWDVVGGRIETTESVIEGLKREVKEESGLDIEIGEIISVTETFPAIKNEDCHIIRLYYSCTTTQESVQLSSDHDSYKWINPADYESCSLMEDLFDVFAKYLQTLKLNHNK